MSDGSTGDAVGEEAPDTDASIVTAVPETIPTPSGPAPTRVSRE